MATLRGLNNDVYFQVALLTTIELSAKNAILIVELANNLIEKKGKGLVEAILGSGTYAFRADSDDLAVRHSQGIAASGSV